MNPEEGELRPQLLDRFGLTVEAAASRDPAQRAEVVRRRLAYEADPAGFAAQWAGETARLAAQVAQARERLGSVRLPDAALDQICAVCASFEVDGLRADLVTARTAIALAAWHGRAEVGPDDIRQAARLALPHRRRRDPFDAPGLDEKALDEALEEALSSPPDGPDDDGSPPPPPPPPPGGGTPPPPGQDDGGPPPADAAGPPAAPPPAAPPLRPISSRTRPPRRPRPRPSRPARPTAPGCWPSAASARARPAAARPRGPRWAARPAPAARWAGCTRSTCPPPSARPRTASRARPQAGNSLREAPTRPRTVERRTVLKRCGGFLRRRARLQRRAGVV